MKCQNCKDETLKVLRTEKFNTCTRRVLLCKSCGWAGTTIEEFMDVCIIKKKVVLMPKSA